MKLTKRTHLPLSGRTILPMTATPVRRARSAGASPVGPRRWPCARPSLLSLAIAGVLMGPAAQAATITVTSSADDDGTGCTLREAIASVNDGGVGATGCNSSGTFGTDDTILFDSAVTGTITLGGTDLEITESVYIDGPGADQLTVDANGQSRVFAVSTDNLEIKIEGLTISNGSSSENGGGIQFDSDGGTLTLLDSTISGNSASGTNVGGGGIYCKDGTLSITNSTVSGNTAYSGGGIYAAGCETTLTNVQVVNNSIGGEDEYSKGGGLYFSTGSAELINTTVSDNSTYNEGGALDCQISFCNANQQYGIGQLGGGFWWRNLCF